MQALEAFGVTASSILDINLEDLDTSERRSAIIGGIERKTQEIANLIFQIDQLKKDPTEQDKELEIKFLSKDLKVLNLEKALLESEKEKEELRHKHKTERDKLIIEMKDSIDQLEEDTKAYESGTKVAALMLSFVWATCIQIVVWGIGLVL